MSFADKKSYLNLQGTMTCRTVYCIFKNNPSVIAASNASFLYTSEPNPINTRKGAPLCGQPLYKQYIYNVSPINFNISSKYILIVKKSIECCYRILKRLAALYFLDSNNRAYRAVKLIFFKIDFSLDYCPVVSFIIGCIF